MTDDSEHLQLSLIIITSKGVLLLLDTQVGSFITFVRFKKVIISFSVWGMSDKRFKFKSPVKTT